MVRERMAMPAAPCFSQPIPTTARRPGTTNSPSTFPATVPIEPPRVIRRQSCLSHAGSQASRTRVIVPVAFVASLGRFARDREVTCGLQTVSSRHTLFADPCSSILP